MQAILIQTTHELANLIMLDNALNL